MSGWAKDWLRVFRRTGRATWLVARFLIAIPLFAAVHLAWIFVYLPLELLTLGRATQIRRVLLVGLFADMAWMEGGPRDAYDTACDVWGPWNPKEEA